VTAFAGMETPGAWGEFLRAFAPWPDRSGALEPCGTVAAYQRHCRHGDRDCPPCQGAVRRARDESRTAS
jgi:hypothetical protein